MRPGYPVQSIWPSNPPREHFYCTARMLPHPLVSQVSAPPEKWKGMAGEKGTDVWFCTGGGEMEVDSVKMVARDLKGQGVRTGYVEMEGMPHLFHQFEDWEQGVRAVELWGKAVRDMLKGRFVGGGMMFGVDGKEREVDIGSLTDLTREQVVRGMRESAGRLKVWRGQMADNESVGREKL